MGFFASKEERIKEAIQKIGANDALSFSTPNPQIEIDIWRRDFGYEMFSRQTQIVGKTVTPNAWQGTYSVNSEMIFLEEPLGTFSSIKDVLLEVQKYRKRDSKYFSKNKAGWVATKNSCVLVENTGVLIPARFSAPCPKCGNHALIASARGRFFVSPPSPSGPAWASGNYFLCFHCKFFKAAYIKIDRPFEIICYECKKNSRDGKMQLRKGRNGYFWGCENYPACKNTKNLYEWETDIVAPRPNQS